MKNLVDVKRALHQHDMILDDKIDKFTKNLGQIDGNVQALEGENSNITKFLAENQASDEPSVDNIDSLVHPANAVSEKLIYYQSKLSGLEDAMEVVKKAFEKDAIPFIQYLSQVRSLSKRQFKCMYRINILTGVNSQSQQPSSHQFPPGPGMQGPPMMGFGAPQRVF